MITARPWRQAGELVDLPAAVLSCGRAAGLLPYERNVALLAGLRDEMLVPGCRSSSWSRSEEPEQWARHCWPSPTRTCWYCARHRREPRIEAGGEAGSFDLIPGERGGGICQAI